MKLLPYHKILTEGERYIVSLDITSKGVVELTIDNLLKLASGRCRTNLAKLIKGKPDRYIIWQGESYFDTVEYDDIHTFMDEVTKKAKEVIDWNKILKDFCEEYKVFLSYYNSNTSVLDRAMQLGQDSNFIKSISNIKFDRDNKIFAYHRSSKLLVFIYKPERRVYIFKINETDTQIQNSLFEKLIETHSERVWCTCEDKNHTDYVEHYKGVNHGWICLKCKRFVQIG